MNIIDTHCHLTAEQFDEDRDAAIKRALDAGVSEMITIGDSIENIKAAIALANANDCIYATSGLHPHNAEQFSEAVLTQISQFADDPKVVAIGELGLDYFYGAEKKEIQSIAYRRQLELAAQKQMPVIIHSREAHDDIMEGLKEFPNPATGVVHCFTGTTEQAREILEMGYKIGIGGAVTFKKLEFLREAVKEIPLSEIIVETDSPYMAPAPNRGKRNEPAFTVHTVRKIAEVKSVSENEVIEQTRQNAIQLFKLPIN